VQGKLSGQWTCTSNCHIHPKKQMHNWKCCVILAFASNITAGHFCARNPVGCNSKQGMGSQTDFDCLKPLKNTDPGAGCRQALVHTLTVVCLSWHPAPSKIWQSTLPSSAATAIESWIYAHESLRKRVRSQGLANNCCAICPLNRNTCKLAEKMQCIRHGQK